MCNDHDYCYVELPNEDNKILKYNNKLYTEKKYMHTSPIIHCLTMFIWFNKKYAVKWGKIWGKYCMERFCKDLKKHAIKIINYEKNKWWRKLVLWKTKSLWYIQKRS